MDRLPVYILVGGKSSRFGSDKARALIEGASMLLHVSRSLVSFAASLTAVADRAHKYEDLGLRTIPDLRPNLGPLGGLATALADTSAEGWLLLASCDRLGLKPSWIQALLDQRSTASGVIAFRGNLWEPLPALYHTSLRSRIETQILDGKLALWRLIEEAHGTGVPLPEGWNELIHANTPGDLEHV